MNARREKLLLAATSAALEFMAIESASLEPRQTHREMSRWKSTRWRAVRDHNYPTASLWKHSAWR